MLLFFVPFRSADKRFDISYLPSGQQQPYPGTNEHPGSRLPISLPACRFHFTCPQLCVHAHIALHTYLDPVQSSTQGCGAKPLPRSTQWVCGSSAPGSGSLLLPLRGNAGLLHLGHQPAWTDGSSAPCWSSECGALYLSAAVNLCLCFGLEQIIPHE